MLHASEQIDYGLYNSAGNLIEKKVQDRTHVEGGPLVIGGDVVSIYPR